jgi:penicillin-binding protein 1A
MEPTVPPGVVNVGGEWFYEEYARNAGVSSLGLENRSSTNPSTATTTTPDDAPVTEERKRILDLFRN